MIKNSRRSESQVRVKSVSEVMGGVNPFAAKNAVSPLSHCDRPEERFKQATLFTAVGYGLSLSQLTKLVNLQSGQKFIG
jgi:hypothetical protein